MSVDEVAPHRRGRPPTLREVAAMAGVSIATASKALNGRQHVGSATRQRVQSAADALNFSPNALAQGMVAQRSGTVGLLTSDLVGRFSMPVLRGAEDAFGSEKMSVLLADARDDHIRQQHHLRALLSRRVDGLIVVGAQPDPRPSLGQDLGVPVVYAYAPSDDPQDMSVVADDVAGGRLAVDHLIRCGRRTIAHVTGDPTYGASHDRARGAVERLTEAGLAVAGGEVMYDSWSEAWGRGATRLLLEREPGLDAVFAGSDQIARGVLDALLEAGKRVPEEVAVIGFDNWEVLATGSRPPLTTIDPALENLGRVAALRLASAIEGRAGHGVEAYPCRLVTRSSTAPLH
ncbi:LacI family DNA-binding transcriptional regulator [Klenkia sp. LSe6-5]|uniref:LacI family DNA-binding transcriptional regulator n=1 Tax=Klenkia sesuvii TaxID=3103137 RepID=A0ABU8DZF1_9ACTN